MKLEGSKLLVVAVHPDDETLGAGGTLLRFKEEVGEIHWLIITNVFEENGFKKKFVDERKEEIKKVKELYQFDSVHNLDYPTTKIEDKSKTDLISDISEVFNTIKPDTIILPFRGDVHSEHGAVFDAAFGSTKVFRYPFVKKIMMMETLSETDFAPAMIDRVFIPNYFIDISKYVTKKINIMSVFKSEIKEHPFPRSTRSIESLATLRGAQAGVEYAEAFMLLKSII